MAEQKLLFCDTCREITCHKVFGNQAVCLNCGDHRNLDEPYVEAEISNQGDRERRV